MTENSYFLNGTVPSSFIRMTPMGVPVNHEYTISLLALFHSILSLSETLVLNLPLKLSPSLTNTPLIKQSTLPHCGMKKAKNSILQNSSNKTVLSGNSWNTKSCIAFFCDQIAESQPSVTGGNWHTSSILQIHPSAFPGISHISSFIGSNFLATFQVSLNKKCSCSSLHAMACCND